MSRIIDYLKLFITLIIMWGIFSSFSNYKAEWTSVEKIANTNPKTAIGKIDAIEKEAISESNYAQRIKCIAYRGKLKENIEDSAFVECVAEMNTLCQSLNDDVAKSMATYMLAKLYRNYYYSNQYLIGRRTDLADSVPEDINEWPSNLFINKIRELTDLALSNETLKKVPSEEYEAILTLGEDSRIYQPTLYDLILSDIVDSHNQYTPIYTEEEKNKFLTDWVEFHANDTERDAYVYAKLKWIQAAYSLDKQQKEKETILQELLSKEKGHRASVLIREAICQEWMKNKNQNCNAEDFDSSLPQRILDVCQEGIDAYPRHSKIGALKNIVNEVKQPTISISLHGSKPYSTDKIKLKLHYANLTKVSFSLYKLKVSSEQFYSGRYNRDNMPTELIKEYSVDLDKTNYYIPNDTIYEIDALPYGAYAIRLDEDNYFYFVVSDLYCIKANSKYEDYTEDFIVMDSKNGAPINDVSIEGQRYREENSFKSKTDKNGFACIKGVKRERITFFFKHGKDTYLNPECNYLSDTKQFDPYENKGEYYSIFTDRSIYRPGQTLYYKVICYKLEDEKSSHVMADKPVNVILYDANSQEVGKQTLFTNEMGSIASSFVLPSNGLAGSYRLKANDESYFFKVEEYKRPTFEVKMTRPTNSFSFGDSIVVSGRADYLLGTPVSEAKIEYRVIRKPSVWWWRPLISRMEENIEEGESSIKEDGTFTVSFLAQKNENDEDLSYYRYSVYAKVTDANGETHEEEIYITVGDRSLVFSSSVPNREIMDKFPEIKYRVMNLNGDGQSATVTYEIKKDEKVIASGKVSSDAQKGFVIDEQTKKWKSGLYNVILSTKDDKGREVSQTYNVILYREDDSCPPVETALWEEKVADVNLNYGEKHTVRIGTSLKDAHLLVIVDDEFKEVEKRWVKLNNETKSFTFSLEKQNGDALHVRFFLVNDGECHRASFRIIKKKESKKMPVKLAVFRDKMLPGSNETWTITVPKERESEVLAAMYDASLDQFARHYWLFSPYYYKILRVPTWQECQWARPSVYWSDDMKQYLVDWKFDSWMMLPTGDVNRYLYRSRRMMGVAKNSVMCVEDCAASMVDEDAEYSSRESDAKVESRQAKEVKNEISEEKGSDQENPDLPKVRTNFSETAFFYPQLRSDKDGNVTLSFQMPESLTRWNFMSVAHTKDLYYGQLQEQMVTQKDFMITPNLPRFLRKGDECVLSAKIINLSESAQKGKAKIQLLDPVTEQPIAENSADFSVEAGVNTSVKFTFAVPREWDAVLVRTSAVADGFSDAEQTLLPILSDRIVLTQSLPIYVRCGQTKNYTFEQLKNNQSETLSSRFLKLEFATNPIWYAVQSLPSIAVVEHENAINYSVAHFASLMAQHIATSNPRIFNVIQIWKEQGKDKETLLSNLEKNQDVKNVLLNETPWVLEARNETERKQRLSTLFDLNDLKNKCQNWENKLKEYRTNEGAYVWFKDMLPSRHVTLFVLDNFARLRKAGIVDNDFLNKMDYTSSLSFMDGEIQKDYEWLKKHYPKEYQKHAYISVEYLYYYQVRSLYSEVAIKPSAKEAYDFYYKLIAKQWKDFSLNGKALAAIVLYRNGDQSLAKKIIESLREFSTTTDEMGMYWQKNVSSYFWQDAAISTHTRIMEAFEVVDPQKGEQDELRLWLLNQKRTQNWGNTIANVDALNVLLLSGSDWLSKDNQVTIKMGDKQIEPEQTEAGTGYFSTIIEGKDVIPSYGDIELKSAEDGNVSWGAMYWQFEEEIDKVLKNKTALHVEKMVMLEQRVDGKPILKTIDANTELKVGDKLVVRITLRTDRDMDYVSLKDQRASCLEPVTQLSGYRCSDGTCYYQSPKDAAMYYFFDHLEKGTFVFEYPLWVTHAGQYSNGITSAQCLYAPEFSTNTGSVKINVK